MPNENDLQQRAKARELRKQNRQANVEKAHAEAAGLSDKQQENEAARTARETAETERKATRRPVAPAPKKPSRAEATRAAKQKHAEQAAVDAQVVPKEVDVPAAFDRWDGRGSPPLHVLNALAAKTDRELRDEGKDIATAAGKAAYEVYVGKVVGKRNRHANMRAQIAAAEAARAAAKQKEA